MADAKKCDVCGKLIGPVHITLHGHTINDRRGLVGGRALGYTIGEPLTDICSFECVKVWADKWNKLLQGYLEMVKDMESKQATPALGGEDTNNPSPSDTP